MFEDNVINTDSDFVEDFFALYRLFVNPSVLIKMLVLRFTPPETNPTNLLKIRTTVLHYFSMLTSRYLPELAFSKEVHDRLREFSGLNYQKEGSSFPSLDFLAFKHAFLKKAVKEVRIKPLQWGGNMKHISSFSLPILDIDPAHLTDELTSIEITLFSAIKLSEISPFLSDTFISRFSPNIVAYYHHQENVFSLSLSPTSFLSKRTLLIKR